MKRRLIVILIVLIAVLSVCVVYVIKNTDIFNSEKENQTEEVDQQNIIENEEELEEETYSIFFDDIELKYPKKWEDKVTVTEDNSRLSFVCEEVPLFDLTFNTNEGYVLGTIVNDSANTVIRIVSYDIDDSNMEIAYMQDDINVILDNLKKDYNFAVGEEVIKEDESTFDINTSVVTLKYPNKWKDAVSVNVYDDHVEFSNGNVNLFDLYFVECDGYLLGTYSGTPIYIVDYSVETDEQAAMQEDVNVILQYLMEDSNFTLR